ncbi:MAG: hypothetical protein JXA90_00555, partial [Planctomycetes bacterium]|nr:hypothetical protein [Planctomycetota bacterium]
MHRSRSLAPLVLSWLGLCATAAAAEPAVEWIRPRLDTDRLCWGIRGGLVWGLPAGRRPVDGPRGLIRLRYPTLPGGREDLINFIAVEPVVSGRRGFSELEWSRLDDVRGLRLVAESGTGGDGGAPVSGSGAAEGPDGPPLGRLEKLECGAERLTVVVRVEKFASGARVALTLSQRSDAPEELELAIRAEADSAPMEYCILTATMGNKARTRLLWLKDKVVSSLKLYPDYRENGFAPHVLFPLERLGRTEAGDALVAITTDEKDPSAVDPFPGRSHWRYAGFPVTQYWRKPAGSWRDDLHAAVNGRFTYWLSRRPIPGGIAFENFELRERYHEGQRFVFGITRRAPADLGFHKTADPTTP